MITPLYEDNHLIAVSKKNNLLSQKDITKETSLFDLVKKYLKEKYNKPGNVYLGLVHRLDKPVSGVMLFAKNSKAAKRLHQEFKERRVIKIYLALVPNKIKISREWIDLNQHLLRRSGFSEIFSTEQDNSKSAHLRYRVISTYQNLALVMVQLFTGRKHQIRAQLSSVNLPILGDNKYGSKKKNIFPEIMLHAYLLSVIHPTKKERINIFSTPPKNFLKTINLSSEKINRLTEKTLNSIIKP